MSHSVRARTRIGAWAVLGLVGATLLVCVSACGSASTAAAPTATPAAPTPTATPAGPTLIFQNTLASPPSPDWVNDPSYGCFFGSGGLHVKGTGSTQTWAGCGVPPQIAHDATQLFQDADITVQVKQISGSTTQLYGIGLGYNSAHTDQFVVESAGKWAFIVCRSNCTASVGPAASPAIHAGLGATNTLEVRIMANNFTFFVNGTQVGQAYDSTYTAISDNMSLIASDGIEVVFSNLKITTAS